MPHDGCVAIVIVNWNGRHLLDACLASVLVQCPAPDRVIVVDNGSADGSLAHLRQHWPQVVALDADSNLEFFAGPTLPVSIPVRTGGTS